MALSEADLRFVVETVATQRPDREKVLELVRDKEDFIEFMLEDEKLVRRVLSDEEILLKISPRLLFDILLRRVRRDLERERYILEPVGPERRIPVFDAPQVAELLREKEPRDYLVDMLSSFARTESVVIYWMEKGKLRRRKFSDMDLDDMIRLSQLVEPEFRAAFYRRIGDIALFISGIFPDYASRPLPWARFTIAGKRSLADYEIEGQRFYNLASRETKESHLGPVFRLLADKFNLARKALNVLSERYIHIHRFSWFHYKSN